MLKWIKGDNMTEELKFLIDIVKKAEEISNEEFVVEAKSGGVIMTSLQILM